MLSPELKHEELKTAAHKPTYVTYISSLSTWNVPIMLKVNLNVDDKAKNSTHSYFKHYSD